MAFSSCAHTTAFLGALEFILSIASMTILICLKSMMTTISLEDLANRILLPAALLPAAQLLPALVDFLRITVKSATAGLHGLLFINLACNVGLLVGVLGQLPFLMMPWFIWKIIGAVPFTMAFLAAVSILPTACSKIFGVGTILLLFFAYVCQLLVASNAFVELLPGNI